MDGVDRRLRAANRHTLRSLPKTLALALIAFYRRVLSPRKGFRCAYAAITGKHSCSAYGQRAVEKHGVSLGVRLITRRLQKCSWHHRRPVSAARHGSLPFVPQSQQGFADCMPFDGLPDCAEFLDCLDCLPLDGCGGAEKREESRRQRRQNFRDAKRRQG